ncbi:MULTISPECIES: Mbeg1-like protein [unclassified Granulicatella]|uniref:Mbeg1-like protein n=1 Tax=unclassified Granulicatella TaxID=2630493 RepID=UPI00142FBE08|nr:MULTISPECIES: Mbeg1-like protein [unclassified Granulicatella]MBF0779976.1 DUF2974 domain-containing protein [Granulicatella sp. 19428wC4_WM01]
MTTIFDYLNWRGDLTFKQAPFNEIDSLILTRFCYLPLDNIVTNTPQTLHCIGKHFFNLNRQNHPDVVMPEDITLLRLMMQTRRFKSLLLQHYINTIDYDHEEQFSALLIQLNKTTSYVAFRGTDLTLVGWKEDLNLAFKSSIPSYHSAVAYLNALEDVLHHHVILGGHSKGGHLALYAGLFTQMAIRSKLIAIHNFDGPGFPDDILQLPQYQTLKPIMRTYAAIVGYIFKHNHTFITIDSSAKDFSKHDTYTWNVTHHVITRSAHIPKSAIALTHVLDYLFSRLSTQQIQHLIDSVYQMALSSHISTITELQKLDFKRISALIKSYNQLTKEDTALIHKCIIEFVKAINYHRKNQ